MTKGCEAEVFFKAMHCKFGISQSPMKASWVIGHVRFKFLSERDVLHSVSIVA